MTELLPLFTDAAKALPVWATLAIGVIALGTVAYMRARGASLDEHVSIARATQAQVANLSQINDQLNKQIKELIEGNKRQGEQIETLIDTNHRQSEQIKAMHSQIVDLETKVKTLEEELRLARVQPPTRNL